MMQNQGRSFRSRLLVRFLPLAFLVLSLSISPGSRVAGTPAYFIHDLGTFGGLYAEARSINSRGAIVGTYTTPSGDQAFMWGSTFVTLGPGSALDINDSDVIVGSSGGRAVEWNGGSVTDLGPGKASGINTPGDIVGDDAHHAFLIQNGVRQDLGTLAGPNSAAFGINDTAQVVGESSFGSSSAFHATLWASGAKRDLGTFGGGSSMAVSINNVGIVVGWAESMDQLGRQESHAFSWDGSLHDLGLGYALGINNTGAIVGQSGALKAFLYSNGVMQVLPDLGRSAAALGINEGGVIVGLAFTMSGEQHAVYWDLLPEPGGLTALGAMLAGLGAAVRCSQRRRPARAR